MTELRKGSRDHFVIGLINANADKGYQAVADILKVEIKKNFDYPPKVAAGEANLDAWIRHYINWAHKVKGAAFIALPAARKAEPKVKAAKTDTVKVKSSGPIKAPNGSLAVKPKSENLTVEEIQDRQNRRIAIAEDVAKRTGVSAEKFIAKIKGESAVAAA